MQTFVCYVNRTASFSHLYGVGETAACKAIHRACMAICKLKRQNLYFPDVTSQVTFKVQFYEYGNFPGVIGTPQLQFSNIVAHWKGATHDSRIFLNSSLYAEFERGDHNKILLGDSGYAYTVFVCTILVPRNN